MSTTTTKKTGFVPTTFRDSGTGKEYEGGKEHEFTAGEHLNFTAAGLIGVKPETADAKGPASAKAPAN